MDKLSLAALLEEDREMALANLAADRSLAGAQAALEKAIDRVMYRFVERCDDETVRDCAQAMLQAMKNTLPVIDSVGEAKVWRKQYDSGSRRTGMKPLSLALLLAGALLVLASVLAVLISGRMTGLLTFLKALLPAAVGGGALFFAGVQSAKPGKAVNAADEPGSVRTEYLADAEKAWHSLHGAMLQADGQLERVRAESEERKQREAGSAAGSPLGREALELFAELLEAAYAAGDDNAREAVSSIRFYLHNARVDAPDYEPGRESWFEFLPAAGQGTIRPALVSGGRVLKKGLASK